MKTFVGIVTFGNLPFTKLTYKSILDTSNLDVCIIVGKPGDSQTAEWASRNNIPHIVHDYNKGFPASINDLYDWGFKHHGYDAYIAIGNDVIAYPFSLDNLVSAAETTDFDWICAKEVSVKSLCSSNPEIRKYFTGDTYLFTEFDQKPWEVFTGYSKNLEIYGGGLSDVHNLALYKRSVFDALGYIDVNFYPAYYEDNDYARRAILLGTKSATINSFYFHFWSRTIHQGSGGSTNKFFDLNKEFYINKWGGDFLKETYSTPFNNKRFLLSDNIYLDPTISIHSRDNEKDIINYWIKRGK